MKPATRKLVTRMVATIALFCMTTQGAFARYLELADQPLFIGANIPPQVMLTISKEQQLFKKAYNDYSDLDEDGQIETTYKHTVDYYGYFDSYKCYTYNTTSQRFEPATVKARNNATDDNTGKPTAAAIEANRVNKYCESGKEHWSGNFLNWITMSRMDTVRKLLYGGMRYTDTKDETVLERAHLPADAHAWAKFYGGQTTLDPATGEVVSVENDIERLTPFNGLKVTPPPPASMAAADTFTIPNPGPTGRVDVDVVMTKAFENVSLGDQIWFEDADNPGRSFKGVIVSIPSSPSTVRVRVHGASITPETAAGTTVKNFKVTNLSRAGITFCNVTFPRSGDLLSHTNQDPPLIRVANGNFGLWNANERYQCYWRNETVPKLVNGLAKVNQMAVVGVDAPGSNGNQAALSGIDASAENPVQAVHSLGSGVAAGDFVVRVRACVAGSLGTERCKQYPDGNYKPIGLLQEYGDIDLIQFGLMTGSYAKNISGGVLRKNVGSFTDEVNVKSDGTFKTTAVPPGSPRTVDSAANTTAGIVNTLNYIRIWGYDYDRGVYRFVDNCTFQLTNITENNCTSWGNPMSEIYFESLRYLAGNSPSDAYKYENKGSKDNQLGLPLPTWQDPLKKENYCAPLNVLVFNASVSTNDDDLRTTSASAINSTSTAEALTNAVGNAEGITSNSYFAGKIMGTGATKVDDSGFELCTPKTIPGLGQVSGICPEGPTVAGSFLMAGLAHHARTKKIRTDIEIPSTDTKSLKVTTYGIQLATNVPTLVIPVPGSTTGQKVVIQPIYRLVQEPGEETCPVGGPQCRGGGALVDLRFISQQTKGGISTGKVYLNWEDSEQGGDFDQDMWGTLEWKLDSAARKITVTTIAIAESTNRKQGFGYAISGTTKDGPHFHSGIGSTATTGFDYKDDSGVLGCKNCQVLGVVQEKGGPAIQTGATSVTYDLGTSTGKTLEDPMWYAAKYGAFVEDEKEVVNGLPDQQKEWDSKLSNGRLGSDGVPDTYFLVVNPLGLVDALERAFAAISSKASAASVATNSTSLQTGTTIYQAKFDPSDWSGRVLALRVDDKGQIAKDEDATWDAGEIVSYQDPLDDTSPPAKAAPSMNPDTIKGSGRAIITVNDSRVGVKFRWPNVEDNPGADEIGKTLVKALNLATDSISPAPDKQGKDRLNWLRGSKARESAAVTGFRVRPVKNKLGDIVNSSPNFVAAPNAGFGDDKYTAFRTENLGRTPMIYVGGNDGMLHAFRAEDGRELLAYIPGMVHNKLNRLTDKRYVGNEHRYYVDGSPEIGDAFIKVGTETAASWRTVLVSALGGGGQGLFALDVTKPGEFSEANAARIALWEFSDKDDPDLGFIHAQPTIRRMANGKFAAIVPGGYNHSKPVKGAKPEDDEKVCSDSAKREPAGCTTSSTGSAYLFIVFLDGPGADGVWDEGTDYIKIRAGVAGDGPDPADGPNGLTQPLAADVNGDGFVDFVYSGDLRGNLWKFDVRLPPAASPLPPVPNTTADITAWTSGDNRVILFTAKDPTTGAAQPITGKPEATLHPQSGFIVTFGTGKYLERNDPFPPSGPPPATPSPYQPQSFYGIWDKNDATPIAQATGSDGSLAPAPRQTVVTSRDQLLPHRIDRSVESARIRVVVQVDGQPAVPAWSEDKSPPEADDSPSKGKHMGWVLDFPNATKTGERSVFRPILTAGRLIFSSLLPLTEACLSGGTSFTMVIDPTTGGRIDGPVLDTDANAQLNKDDVVSYGGTTDIFASGVQSTIGITPTPTIIRASSLPPDSAGKGSQILGTSGPLVGGSGVLLAYALAAGSSGGNASTMIGLSAAGGRVSWRELTAD